MEILLMLLAFGLFLAFIIGMLKPSILLKTGNPTRKKVMLYFLLPSIICFILFVQLTNAADGENWNHPESATELRLTNDKLTELPEKLKEFKLVVSLNLFNNEITTLDREILESMVSLKELQIASNPITTLPDWVGELGLQRLDIHDTQIISLSDVLRTSIPDIDYSGTPLYLAETPKREAYEKQVAAVDDSTQKTESFMQFAARSLLNKDYGNSKEFNSGHIYYTANISEDLVVKLGQFMIDQGYFTDDQPIDVQLTYKEGEVNAYILKMIYTPDTLDDETKLLFQFLGIGIMDKVLDAAPLYIHLTDEEFETEIIVAME